MRLNDGPAGAAEHMRIGNYPGTCVPLPERDPKPAGQGAVSRRRLGRHFRGRAVGPPHRLDQVLLAPARMTAPDNVDDTVVQVHDPKGQRLAIQKTMGVYLTGTL